MQNISFQILVVAQFTLDCRKTTSKLVAEYEEDMRNLPSDCCDTFRFRMELAEIASIDEKSVLLCVRYNVNRNDYWDKNDNLNYHMGVARVVKESMELPPDFHDDVGPLSSDTCVLHPASKPSNGHSNPSLSDSLVFSRRNSDGRNLTSFVTTCDLSENHPTHL